MRQNIALLCAIREQGLTQRKVAERADINETIFSMIVRGRFIPDMNQKRRISRVLGMREDKLFTSCHIEKERKI